IISFFHQQLNPLFFSRDCLIGFWHMLEQIMVPKHCRMSSTSSMKNHFQAWSHLAVVYTRILEHPIQRLDWYFNWNDSIFPWQNEDGAFRDPTSLLPSGLMTFFGNAKPLDKSWHEMG
uniref:Uncharacterized protein n=1 Tax=Aegilops tauschii subsp. strangulata TaxID=200361 RepID=A0A453CBJ0_AEGTS